MKEWGREYPFTPHSLTPSLFHFLTLSLFHLTDMEHPEPLYETARHYMDGPFADRNPAEAFRMTREAAEMGHAEAICQLGRCYALGVGVACDPEKAMTLWREAAEKDVPEAWFLLGRSYFYGQYTPCDRKKAVELLQKAERYTATKVLLAGCCLSGEGIRKDKKKGLQLLKEAEEIKASPRTYVELGNIWLFGEGVKQDYARALEWYRRAADYDMAPALAQIAWFYLTGTVVEKDTEKALEILRRPEVAELDVTDALLAYCYHSGIGVEKNLDEAAKFYRSAAEKGGSYSEYTWGRMLDEGSYGIPQDRAEADKWLNRAAEKDYVWTQKKESDWRALLWPVFCMYWLWIPFLAVILPIAIMAGKVPPVRTWSDVLFFADLYGYLLPSFALFVAGALGSLRCARWGSVWMAFASLEMAVFACALMWRSEKIGYIIFIGVLLLILLFASLSACHGLAERTYWRERKFHRRRITFAPTIRLAATVFCAIQAVRFLLWTVWK